VVELQILDLYVYLGGVLTKVSLDELRKDNESSRVHEAEMGYALSVALQIGLVDVLRSWGVEPNAVIGHSSGEIAAAYASGAITAESAIAAGIFRGAFNTQSSRAGSMAAVGIGRESILPYLLPGVVVACENSQCSTTLSGDTQAVESTVQLLKEAYPSVFTRFLRVEKAYHSRKSYTTTL
jgi:acyl transferase domain-containing protein